MRVIREVDARRRVRRTAAGIDAERTDFPVGGNRPDDKEDQDQGRDEEQEAEAAPAPALRFVARARHDNGWRRAVDGRYQGEAGWHGGKDRLRRDEGSWRRRDRRLRGKLGSVLRRRFRFGRLGLDRRARRWRCATTSQIVEPRLQRRLIGSEIMRLYGTPWEEAHVRPR